MTESRRVQRVPTIAMVGVESLYPDSTNPRRPDQARMALLRLSLQKFGFMLPVYATKSGMLLSGHQRFTVAKSLGYKEIPVAYVDVKEADVKGINVLFNRASNDFSAFDTGAIAQEKLHYSDVLRMADGLPDFTGKQYALLAKETQLKGLGALDSGRYDKKATVMADSLLRLGIRIPVVVSESGKVVNGIHRLFAAKERGLQSWPVVTVPDSIAAPVSSFLNYLSMDFHVDEQFADTLRFSAYRRPQNNRGAVPKAYRFWANGCRTLLDADSYSADYWRNFRDIHGSRLLDFGAGLCKVAPYLNSKGFSCAEFEPYRIDMEADKGKPSVALSKQKALEFLQEVADNPEPFDSIFLASVLNSVPFPKDRMVVLAIVHALSDKNTVLYGTCRDISDFNYEYGGIRNANYFVFDSEPGVRVGDVVRNPKIQKFHTKDEADAMLSRLWNRRAYWPGGNVFYFKAEAPKGVNTQVLRAAIELEFDLPYADGSRMGLVEEACKAFSKRLQVQV